MDAAEARQALEADRDKRRADAERVFSTAVGEIRKLGFAIHAAVRTVPAGEMLFALAAEIQLTEIRDP